MAIQKKTKAYIIGIIIPVAVGLLAAFFTRDSMDIYKTVVKPALAPPGLLFPIVWSILYVVMGVGSALLYNSAADPTDTTRALFIYGLQLAVNFLWSIWFFNLRAYLFSFIWLILLWLLIVAMIQRFRKIKPVAGWLQIPYLLWVTFAGYLNLAIYLLNR